MKKINSKQISLWEYLRPEENSMNESNLRFIDLFCGMGVQNCL